MFVGHYGVAGAAKPTAKHVPLWVFFVAVQWLDVVWSVLVLVGIEKLRIVPGFTQANALDLYYMPYTHSLPGAAALSLLFGAAIALAYRQRYIATFGIVSAAAFSHWLLDLVVHVPDLPLYDDAAKVGLGLWRHVALSFPLELVLLIAGTWMYARAVPAATAKARAAPWAFVVLMAALQVYVNFGPPPPSERMMAILALTLYVLLAAIAAWVERVRTT